MRTFYQCIFAIALFLSTGSTQAQSLIYRLQQEVPGKGKITIHQDPRLELLIGRVFSPSMTEGEAVTVKVSGYRIQIYAGNNSRQARAEAANMEAKVRTNFPELSLYTLFVSPRWLCRAGDFTSIEEADAMMRKLKETGLFRELSIVKEQINVSY
jgi:hypothetical protein